MVWLIWLCVESKAELPKWLREFPNVDWFLLSNTTAVIALLVKNFLDDDSEIVELVIDVAASMTNLKSEQMSY
ncbi:hypothetical protein EAE91_16520 [Photorhabdus noenieputensis]|uniref:hypothetical protein n=1 Tax=Photorhabdus TaxID=29487 RepID=UPI00056885C9|nr:MULTISPECIES: hypothetical protein [Photorhabdus]MBS9438688.1 hypothetical protein [Photorhabdus noenieputensis]MCK3668118.1 hypothetical protein [Photorhabdus noenieputensis]